MQGYFCISSTGREFLYLPFNLLVYDSLKNNNLKFCWDPEILAKITLLLKEGKLNRERLEDRAWDIYEIDVPDKFVKKFRYLCEKKNKKKCSNLASRIFNWIEDNYDSMGNAEDEADEMYEDYENYLDDWWLRGEDPPFYSMDEQ
jgi:hypothetical protein